jgi:hypothetical protein
MPGSIKVVLLADLNKQGKISKPVPAKLQCRYNFLIKLNI